MPGPCELGVFPSGRTPSLRGPGITAGGTLGATVLGVPVHERVGGLICGELFRGVDSHERMDRLFSPASPRSGRVFGILVGVRTSGRGATTGGDDGRITSVRSGRVGAGREGGAMRGVPGRTVGACGRVFGWVGTAFGLLVVPPVDGGRVGAVGAGAGGRTTGGAGALAGGAFVGGATWGGGGAGLTMVVFGAGAEGAGWVRTGGRAGDETLGGGAAGGAAFGGCCT